MGRTNRQCDADSQNNLFEMCVLDQIASYTTYQAHYADGAALFYTTSIPQTLQILRQYALHLLFTPPAPSPGLTSEAAVIPKNPFPFQHKPNTLDRDRIVVPAGWDSWGKIAVLRDGFDAKAWGEAWEHDVDQAEGEQEQPSARRLYSSLVPDQGPKVSHPFFMEVYYIYHGHIADTSSSF